jgi:hypothetical protein
MMMDFAGVGKNGMGRRCVSQRSKKLTLPKMGLQMTPKVFAIDKRTEAV